MQLQPRKRGPINLMWILQALVSLELCKGLQQKVHLQSLQRREHLHKKPKIARTNSKCSQIWEAEPTRQTLYSFPWPFLLQIIKEYGKEPLNQEELLLGWTILPKAAYRKNQLKRAQGWSCLGLNNRNITLPREEIIPQGKWNHAWAPRVNALISLKQGKQVRVV